MKKIVKGNDFTLRIPVCKMVDGKKVPYPLRACTDLEVSIGNGYRIISLAYDIDVSDDNVILAKVEGDKIGLGCYYVKVKGKLFGKDWCSKEYPQFKIVDKNADADYEFGETDEGDNSVEMDTALVILPPTVELSGLIGDVDGALKKVDETMADVKKKTDKALTDCASATTSAGDAAKEASKQADRAKGYADHPNKISDDGYWMAWDEETGEYVKTEYYARGGLDFPTFNVNDDDMSLEVLVGHDTDEGRYFVDEDGCLCVRHNV